MEFFKVTCPGKGKVSIDGSYQGENTDGTEQKIFQCNPGAHDISMECLEEKQCAEPVKRVQIEDTNPILPKEIYFICS
ncbi:MAG: hypothetical protein K8S18_18835 [Desulfobacula sp.]|nr:hypothetical protein [Desulfobacula sp.]